jgi:hypothetical protein
LRFAASPDAIRRMIPATHAGARADPSTTVSCRAGSAPCSACSRHGRRRPARRGGGGVGSPGRHEPGHTCWAHGREGAQSAEARSVVGAGPPSPLRGFGETAFACQWLAGLPSRSSPRRVRQLTRR